MVPMLFKPRYFSTEKLLTPSTPPMYAALSIMAARAGCCLLVPNESTFLSLAANFALKAALEIPLEWQIKPRIDVSYLANSRYFPSITITGSFG